MTMRLALVGALLMVATVTGCAEGADSGGAEAAGPATVPSVPQPDPVEELEPEEQGQCTLVTTEAITDLGFGRASDPAPTAAHMADCRWEVSDGSVQIKRYSSVWWGQENRAEAVEFLGEGAERYYPVTGQNACDLFGVINRAMGQGDERLRVVDLPPESGYEGVGVIVCDEVRMASVMVESERRRVAVADRRVARMADLARDLAASPGEA